MVTVIKRKMDTNIYFKVRYGMELYHSDTVLSSKLELCDHNRNYVIAVSSVHPQQKAPAFAAEIADCYTRYFLLRSNFALYGVLRELVMLDFFW